MKRSNSSTPLRKKRRLKKSTKRADSESRASNSDDSASNDVSNASASAAESLGTSRSEVQKWRKLVRSCYPVVKEKYEEDIRSKVDSLFEDNSAFIKENVKARFQIRGKIGKFDLKAVEKTQVGEKRCASHSLEKGRAGSRAQIRTMASVKSLPSMYAWLPVQNNYAVDDHLVLSHIPFGADSDSNFVKDLMAVYESRVHGTSDADFLNDRLLYLLLESLSKIATKDEKRREGVDLPEAVFEALAAEFPEKGPGRQIRKQKYPDLLEKYDQEEHAKVVAESVIPSMDGADALSVSRERSLHSFLSLFCNRCSKYDCFLHGPSESPVVSVRKKSEADDAEYRRQFPLVPCSDDCYLHDVGGFKNTQHFNRSMSSDCLAKELSSPSKKRRTSPRIFEVLDVQEGVSYAPEKSCCWTPADESMFRVFRGVYGDDYCAIAESLTLVSSKTCRQVREFALKEGPISPQTNAPMSPNMVQKSSKKSHQDLHRQFRVMKWSSEDDQGQVSNRYPYIPCSHPGPCSVDNCICAGRHVLCMKFCKCSSNCNNRFPGCRCRAHCNTRQCPCFMAYRECDPDLCTTCGAGDFESETINCTNVCIQRGKRKNLLLAPSDVSGWGIYIRDPLTKNEFISEYCGELISQEEADRRGKIYDQNKCSYLFNLNQEQAVDATKRGNKIRFANHSVNPNCYAKVLMVNGDHRIGIFARHDVNAGDELFFDYRYKPGEQLKFVSIERMLR